jgi:UDP-glucose:(heptosyl)LPS alpha-1,3-glucosyltransferase
VRFVKLDHRGATRTGKYLRFLDSLDAHLKENRYDIVHAMLPVRQCDVYHPHAGIAAEANQKWTVAFNPRRRAMAKVEGKLLSGSNAPLVLALSDYIKGFIRKHYALPEDRLATLFNAVNLERFQPQPIPHHQPPKALFIGHDWERKGLMPAIVAMRRISCDRDQPLPLHLIVVGKKPSSAHLPPTTNDIQQVGETCDTRPYYATADFFVLPTKHDPCSLVVLEALAMGLPVISTKFNGACEIMTDGVHGYVLDDPDDVNALADAMRKMLDPQRRAQMNKACLELRPMLSYEHHLDRLEEIYRRATKGDTSVAPT